MSNQDTDQAEDARQQDNADQKDVSDQRTTADEDGVERYESGQIAEKPEPTDEHKQHAKEMHQSYEDQRPTSVLPGSDGTVTGKAVNDWIDDEGNPVHGAVSEERKEVAERDRERNQRAQPDDGDADQDGGSNESGKES